MNVENIRPGQNDPSSYGTIFKEVGTSIEHLFQSELELVKAELTLTKKKLARSVSQAATAGAFLILSVFPFLAFLVIGLGDLMNGNYSMSALIVAAVCAIVGGILSYRAYKNIQAEDFSLPRTQESITVEKNIISEKFDNVKDAAKRGVA